MNRKKLGMGQKKGVDRAVRWRPTQSPLPESKDKKQLHWFYIAVDLLLVSAVVAGALLVYVIWAPTTSEMDFVGEPCTVQYTLVISDIRAELITYAREGMTVTAFDTGEGLGTTDAAKTEVYTDEAGKHTVLLLTLTAEARYVQEKGYYIGDFRVAAGNDIAILFENVYGMARCVDVAVKE